MTERPGALPVSIVIPTVGRPGPLRRCLGSIAECDPTAEDLLVPALRHFERKKRPAFAPLYLKPASYEAKHASRAAR